MAQQEITPLTPAEEDAFRRWLNASRITDASEPDAFYDYRGLFKELKGAPVPVTTDRHFPDTYKQHGHPTFSVESQYSRGPTDGGRWEGDRYVPAAASDQRDVVIVGDDGTEHVFPPGFDPKRAAAIVRGQSRTNLDRLVDGLPSVFEQGRRSAAPTSEDLPASSFARWFEENLRPVLEQVAHPKTISDIAQLLIPDSFLSATVRAGGRGTAAAGRGVEAVAQSRTVQRAAEMAGTGGVGGEIFRGSPGTAAAIGAAAAVAPEAAAMTGRGLQRAGAAIERAATDVPAVVEAAPAAARAPGGARTLNEAMQEWQAAEAAKRAQTTSPGRSARGGTAPRAGRPSSAATPESPTPPPATPTPPARPTAPATPTAPAKPVMTAPEVKLYQNLRAKGLTEAEARDVVAAARKLSGNLPTDADVRNAVQKKNARTRPPRKE